MKKLIETLNVQLQLHFEGERNTDLIRATAAELMDLGLGSALVENRRGQLNWIDLSTLNFVE